MKKVIIDVDTGIDDAIALILAKQSNEANILGVTTTCGNISLEKATINTKKVMKLLQIEKEIPVIPGADKPLQRAPFYETNVHGTDGIGGALTDVKVDDVSDVGYAPDFMIEQAKKHKGEITFILLAPLTNMAIALQKEPKLNEWIKELVIMGGAVSTSGNITPTAEFNLFVDPEAAKAVFHSGIPITMIGLDVTSKTLLSEENIKAIERSDVGDFIKDCTKHYVNRYFELNGVKSCVMHDPLAVGVALDKTLVRTEKHYIDIETNSDLCDGQTVADFKNTLKKTPNVDVCLEVDHNRFIEKLMESLNRK